MKHYFKLFLDKLLCKHKWEEHYRNKMYQDGYNDRPFRIDATLICSKCGKIKKINLL